MFYKNVKNTSNDKCKCESWLAHWERFSGQRANKCARNNCNERATDGAHVSRFFLNDEIYILPLCHKHNLDYNSLIDTEINPVSADISKTCGKTNSLFELLNGF
jgi:hypothetical protein